MNRKKTQRYFPWWLYLILAIVIYSLFKYVLPNTDTLSPQLQGLAEQVAPILTIIFLILAANGLYNSQSPPSSDDNDNGSSGESP